MNPWLGAKRGHLSDWTTQQWVRRTGRRALRLWGRAFLRLHYAMQRA